MTLTSMPPDEAVTEGRARADFITDLTDLRTFYATRDGAPLPETPVMNIPVKGRTRDEKMSRLREIAARLGVPVLESNGVCSAARRFGSILLEAHVDTFPARRIIAAQDARKAAAA